MSMEYLTLAFSVAITGTKKAVLVALADRANKAGYCYPSMDDIAYRAGCSKRSALRAVSELEALGYLVVIREQGRLNKYVLLPEKLSPTSDDAAPDEVIHSGDTVSKSGDISVKTGDTMSSKPINPINPNARARDSRKNDRAGMKNQVAYQPYQPDPAAKAKPKTVTRELKNIRALLFGQVGRA